MTAGPPLSAVTTDHGLSRDFSAPFPVNVPLTLSVHRRGGGDPTYATDAAGAVWRTSLTPDGPATLSVGSRDAVITARAWGPGAGWLLDRVPGWLGFHDDRSGFAAHHRVVGELALRYEGLRVGRTGRVFEALVPAVLEQKVVGREAHRAWRFLLLKYGEPARARPRSGCAWFRRRGPGRASPPGTGTGPASRAYAPARSSTLRPPRPGSRKPWTWTRPRQTAACARCPASASGPRPRSGSAPRATRTRSRSATTTCRTWSAGRWPAARPTTPACSSSSSPTPVTATG